MAKKQFFQESELVFKEKPINPKFNDITGLNFGRLKVLGLQKQRNKLSYWFCKCECGNIISARLGHLTTGRTKSCGCFRVDCMSKRQKTHGISKTSIHYIWCGMLSRCRNKSNPTYHRYGGRGITVCERWLKFENFLADMGERPEGLTLDRIENDKGYYKENCRWATPAEQSSNKSNNVYVEINGVNKQLFQWARESGIQRCTLKYRINNGWVGEMIISPVRKYSKQC